MATRKKKKKNQRGGDEDKAPTHPFLDMTSGYLGSKGKLGRIHRLSHAIQHAANVAAHRQVTQRRLGFRNPLRRQPVGGHARGHQIDAPLEVLAGQRQVHSKAALRTCARA